MTEAEAESVCCWGLCIIEDYHKASFPVTRSNNANLSDSERRRLKEYEGIVEFVRKTFYDTSKPATMRCYEVAHHLVPYFRPLQGVYYIEYIINRLCYMAHTGNINTEKI